MTASRRRSVTAIVIVCLLAMLGGCGRGEGDDAKVPAAATAPVRRDLPASVSLTASGGAEIVLRSELPFTVSRFEPARADLRLFTFGLAEFAPLPDGRRVRLAVDLAGKYDGPGRYEFGAAGTPGEMSAAFLHVVTLHDPSGPMDDSNVASATSFDRILAPCAVEVEEAERIGRLTCPRLGAEDGSEIDLHLEWEAT
jgi:hypothetical protein